MFSANLAGDNVVVKLFTILYDPVRTTLGFRSNKYVHAFKLNKRTFVAKNHRRRRRRRRSGKQTNSPRCLSGKIQM